MSKLKEWKLEDNIKTRKDLVDFLSAAIDDIINIQKPHKSEMQWLAIACNDYLRIAKQKGWVD